MPASLVSHYNQFDHYTLPTGVYSRQFHTLTFYILAELDSHYPCV